MMQNIEQIRKLAMNSPKEIFEFFEGKWSVERKIYHYEEGSDLAIHAEFMDCSGQTIFARHNSHILIYSEELELQNSNWHQEYQYKYSSEENSLVKYFSNGDYFYELEPQKTGAKGTHKCIDDYYNSEYAFLNENEMQITYKIKGPQKNHEIITSYKRI
jgi:hypothetical protein